MITFQFDTPTVVNELDVIEHVNGVTILHAYAGNSLDSMTDIGSSVGSLGDLTGVNQMYNGQLNEFEFSNTISGTYFQVVVEKASFAGGFAFFRMYPEGYVSVQFGRPDRSARIDRAGHGVGRAAVHRSRPLRYP